jgi:hypothetical protein
LSNGGILGVVGVGEFLCMEKFSSDDTLSSIWKPLLGTGYLEIEVHMASRVIDWRNEI